MRPPYKHNKCKNHTNTCVQAKILSSESDTWVNTGIPLQKFLLFAVGLQIISRNLPKRRCTEWSLCKGCTLFFFFLELSHANQCIFKCNEYFTKTVQNLLVTICVFYFTVLTPLGLVGGRNVERPRQQNKGRRRNSDQDDPSGSLTFGSDLDGKN